MPTSPDTPLSPSDVPISHSDWPLSPRDTPLSPRQETFCHSYVYYPNAANAAREAGYEAGSSRQHGHRLLNVPSIAALIAAIRQRMAVDGCGETGVLLGKLENVYNRAIEDRHYVAAARTVEIQARLAGLMPSVNERLRAAGRPSPAAPQEAPPAANRKNDDK